MPPGVPLISARLEISLSFIAFFTSAIVSASSDSIKFTNKKVPKYILKCFFRLLQSSMYKSSNPIFLTILSWSLRKSWVDNFRKSWVHNFGKSWVNNFGKSWVDNFGKSWVYIFEKSWVDDLYVSDCSFLFLWLNPVIFSISYLGCLTAKSKENLYTYRRELTKIYFHSDPYQIQ